MASEKANRKVLELYEAGVCYRRRHGLFGKGLEFWALQEITLELFRGETLGVIGRNGAGKTSLLRLVAGIIRPDRGRFVNYGYRATLLSLQVGFVDHLTGRENVILSGMLLSMQRQEIEAKMGSIVEFAELADFIDEPIATYSTGMRARLGFSTAFHVDPEILLIDEVLGVGDAEFREKSKAAMRERIQSDKSVVLASHSTNLIRSVCDRVVWIEKGRVRGIGAVDDVVVAYERSLRQKQAPQ